MGAMEWSKKEDLIAEQSLRHLRVILRLEIFPFLSFRIGIKYEYTNDHKNIIMFYSHIRPYLKHSLRKDAQN